LAHEPELSRRDGVARQDELLAADGLVPERPGSDAERDDRERDGHVPRASPGEEARDEEEASQEHVDLVDDRAPRQDGSRGQPARERRLPERVLDDEEERQQEQEERLAEDVGHDAERDRVDREEERGEPRRLPLPPREEAVDEQDGRCAERRLREADGLG